MNDSMPTIRCRKLSKCLSFSKKMAFTGVVTILLFLSVGCIKKTAEKGDPTPPPPKTVSEPQQEVAPPPTPSLPPSASQEPPPPSPASPQRTPKAIEPVISTALPQEPIPQNTVSSEPLPAASLPNTMNSTAQPVQTASTTPSSSVFETPPDAPERFHLMHPINPKESCATLRCHALKKTVQFAHAPVAAGACVLCHQDVVSNPPLGLKDTGPNLCMRCHEAQKALNNQARFVHAPVKEKCLNCHNPHGSPTNKFFLKVNPFTLCLSCHQNGEKNPDEVPQIGIAKLPHKPVVEGRCAGCHNPHASNFKKLLRVGPQETKLCFSCHKEKAAEIKKASFIHGPIREGLCTTCHSPHGTDSPRLLKFYFVKKFYNPFDPKLYALCFQCHKKTLVLNERTTTLTNFRNGDRNLHYLHVNREKGRTCVACHEVHAGAQEKQIRNSTPFGDWNIPIEFVKTSTGGKCLVSCHIPREYDRVNPLKLNVDTTQAQSLKQRGG